MICHVVTSRKQRGEGDRDIHEVVPQGFTANGTFNIWVFKGSFKILPKCECFPRTAMTNGQNRIPQHSMHLFPHSSGGVKSKTVLSL